MWLHFSYCFYSIKRSCSEDTDEMPVIPSQNCNIGRSLLADYCESYQSDFVLHGTSDRSFLNDDLHRDLQTALKVVVVLLYLTRIILLIIILIIYKLLFFSTQFL